MNGQNNINPEVIDKIAKSIFGVLPLLRKRLLHIDALQSEHGTPLSHVQVLSMLSDTGSMSVSEISRRLGIAKPNITPLVDKLIETGLVDRKRDAVDRRVVNIVILPAGRMKLEAIHKTIVEQVSDWSQHVSPSEYIAFSDALDTITRILVSTSDKEYGR